MELCDLFKRDSRTSESSHILRTWQCCCGRNCFSVHFIFLLLKCRQNVGIICESPCYCLKDAGFLLKKNRSESGTVPWLKPFVPYSWQNAQHMTIISRSKKNCIQYDGCNCDLLAILIENHVDAQQYTDLSV